MDDFRGREKEGFVEKRRDSERRSDSKSQGWGFEGTGVWRGQNCAVTWLEMSVMARPSLWRIDFHTLQ